MQPRELRDLLTRRDKGVFSRTLNAITAHFERWPRQARANLRLFRKYFRPGFDGCLFRTYSESRDALRIIGSLLALGVAPDHIRLACYAKRIDRDPDDGSEIIEAWAKRLREGWKNLFGEDLEPGRIVVHRRSNPRSDAARRYLVVAPVFPNGSLLRTSKGFWGAVLFAATWLDVADERQRTKQKLATQEANP